MFANFDIQKWFIGVNSYNIEKLKSLCEKEFFEGDLNLEFLGVEKDERMEYDERYKIDIFRLQVESNKKEKFHYACKLVHELAANIYESYKKLDYRYDAKIQHRFKIIK